MLPPNNPDRIRIVFDDHRLVANAGLLLSATLAQHLACSSTITLTSAARRDGRTRGTRLTLVASALAGGDCIRRALGTVSLGCMVRRHPP